MILKKRNMFLVLNPLQIICAQEAREKFCTGEFNHLIVINRNGIGSLEYRQKINEIDGRWSKITEISEQRNRSFSRNFVRIWNTLIILLRHGFRRGKVFVGDAYLNWFRYLGNIFGREVVWMDDGASSINVIKKFISKGLLNGPNQATPKFFTIFGNSQLVDETDNAIMVNELVYLCRKRNTNQSIKEKTVFFIGQWLSEKGGVDQAHEVSILRKLAVDLDGWQISYISHRHESVSKLSKINEFMNVVSLDVSIEAMLLSSEHIPEKIISWYSTALFTLKPLLPETKFLAIKVPLEFASKQQAAEWLAVYDALEKSGVVVKSQA